MDHYDFIIDMLNEWLNKHSEELNIPDGKLIEKEDFQLSINSNGSSEDACISCSCGIKIRLTKNRGRFSLSNYYKHIKSKKCSMMKKKKTINSQANDKLNVVDDDESFDIEIPQNNYIVKHSQSSASSITFNRNDNSNKPLKRSITYQSNDLSNTKRTRK